MSNKVKFGISQVHVSKITENAGVTTYASPYAILGAVSLTATPDSEEVKFEADNDPNYFANFANKGYGIELSMALIPDKFKTDFLGYKTDANGMVVEDTEAVGSPFALMFQVDGDTESVRYVYYKCTAGRPTLSPKTGKMPEAETVPIVVGKPIDSKYSTGYVKPSTSAQVYADWFTSVQSFSSAVLSSLALTGGTLVPVFSADKSLYTGVTNAAKGKVTFTAPAGSTATMKANNVTVATGVEFDWIDGVNKIVITVVKGTTEKTYYNLAITKAV